MRHKIITIVTLLLSIGYYTQAQSHDEIIKSIEKNNLSLQAYRAEINARTLENKTGLTLSDPEMEFNHLWISPDGTTRQDISVSQSVDFATISGIKKRVAGKSNEILEEEYRQERIATLLKARIALINLTRLNAELTIQQARHSDAQQLVELYKKSVDNGNNSIIEYNKALVNATYIKAALQNTKLERQKTLFELQLLNGGLAVDYSEAQFTPQDMPIDFNVWYEQVKPMIPEYIIAKKNSELSSKQVTLSKMESMPEISAGYMSEGLKKDEKAHGITLGISIPLWGNKNNIKQAKAAEEAHRIYEKSVEQELYYTLYAQYEECKTLKQNSEELRFNCNNADHSELLKKAVYEGQISLTDYIVEMEMIYEMHTETLNAECEYNTALATLISFTK